MSKERWNAVKWVARQLRILIDNKYDATHEPSGSARTVEHEVFLKMIRPAFHKDAGDADLAAVLKRAVVVLNTKNFIYVRLATEKSVPVRRFPLESYELF